MNDFENQVDGYAEGEEPVVFHYQKGDFRKREPKVYADLATGKNQPGKGFFKVLVNTKGNRFMFFTLVMVFALVIIVSLLTGKSNVSVAGGIQCSLDAFSYEDTVYTSVELTLPGKKQTGGILGLWKKSEPSTELVEQQVYATFYFYDSDGDLTDKKDVELAFNSFSKDGNFIRSSVTDFSVAKVECEIHIQEDQLLLKQDVKKR